MKYLPSQNAKIITPLILYLSGLALLLFNLGSHPPYPYNWENYTIWDFLAFWNHPSWSLFQITNGAMTDSGKSPFIVLPVWAAFKAGGIGLIQMRLPIALITSLTIPFFWVFSRKISNNTVSNTAAILLLISPVFLLYGRTATLVGMSLLPTLLTSYSLFRILKKPGDWHWLIILQGLLIMNSYAYAPIRFMWPISIIILTIELIIQGGRKRLFLINILITLIMLPMFLYSIYDRPSSFINPIESYYEGRGEQIFSIDSQRGYHFYLRENPANSDSDLKIKQKISLPLALITQNGVDWGRKLLDIKTRSVLLNYWQKDARLYSGLLVPFFLAGFLYCLIKSRRETEYRLLLILFLGFGLPLLLTSHADVGRLIFTLPFLILITASGFIFIINFVYEKIIRFNRICRMIKYDHYLIACIIILSIGVANGSWQDYKVSPTLNPGETYCSIIKNVPYGVTDYGYEFGCY